MPISCSVRTGTRTNAGPAIKLLGSAQECRAVLDAAASGVSVIASAHGSSLKTALNRPVLSGLADAGVFMRYVLLSDVPGRIKEVYDNNGQPLKSVCTGRMVI